MAFGPRSLEPGQDPQKFYTCPYCELTFATKQAAKLHAKKEHKVKLE